MNNKTRNIQVKIYVNHDEKELIDKICNSTLMSRRQAVFDAFSKVYKDSDVLDDRSKARLQQIVKRGISDRFYVYSIMHKTVMMKAMEMAKKDVPVDLINENLVQPYICILEIEGMTHGVFALKRFEKWMTIDENDFMEYVDKFWHDKNRIHEMIDRIETESLNKAMDRRRKKDDGS